MYLQVIFLRNLVIFWVFFAQLTNSDLMIMLKRSTMFKNATKSEFPFACNNVATNYHLGEDHNLTIEIKVFHSGLGVTNLW